MPHTIFHDVHIRADVSSVFDSISQPKHINNWWTKKCSGVATKGSKYNLYFTDVYDWYGEVTDCIPDKSFAITMTKSDADWDFTTFGFEVESIYGDVSTARNMEKMKNFRLMCRHIRQYGINVVVVYNVTDLVEIPVKD